MTYCGTVNVERIIVHPMDDKNNTQFVELVKYSDEPVFSVWVDNGTREWGWDFDMTCPSNYERVKQNVFYAISACDTMPELTEALDIIFIDEFEDILIEDECGGCIGCDGCKYLQ